MTLPNKLTMFRIILVPVMVAIAYIPFFNNQSIGTMSLANFINIIIFAVASFTDFLDGSIARKRNLVTTFGKFADPLADKLLVISAMVVLSSQFKVQPQIAWFMPAINYDYSKYLAIAVLACLDSVFGGFAGYAENKFDKAFA